MHTLWLVLAVWSVLTTEIVEVSADCAKISTFNTGLLTQIPVCDARKSLIPTGLSQTDSDVFCLQEVWLERDIEFILNHNGINDKYPFHYSPIHAGVSKLRCPSHRYDLAVQSACSQRDNFFFTVFVGSCIANGCTEEFAKSSLHGTACAVQRCQQFLNSPLLKAECIQCRLLFMQSITEGGEQCMPNSQERNNRLNPAGLLLLSKKPLRNAKYTNFHKGDRLVIERGYIQADVEGVGQVVCTHLTSIFPLFLEYDSKFENYNDMQRYQINQLIQKFNDRDVVLAGDFNAGPEISQTVVGAEFPDNYQLFVDAGYTDPFADKPGECSYCVANPFVVSPNNNALIDHIFLGGTSLAGFSPRRIMDDIKDPPYSDHYGVEVKVCQT